MEGKRSRLRSGSVAAAAAVALAGAGGSAVGLGAPAWLAGAVGAVSALVAAAAVDRVFHRRDDRVAAAERRDEMLDVLAAAAPGDQDDVLGLLRPDRSPVPFRGRGAELRRLADWCADVSGNPVLVISGPAGVGKSRLALTFALRLPEQWARGWLHAGAGATAAGAVRACRDPAMILVDDADGRADLAAFLGAVAEGYARPVIRVILLARSGQAWPRRWHRSWRTAMSGSCPVRRSWSWNRKAARRTGSGGSPKQWPRSPPGRTRRSLPCLPLSGWMRMSRCWCCRPRRS